MKVIVLSPIGTIVLFPSTTMFSKKVLSILEMSSLTSLKSRSLPNSSVRIAINASISLFETAVKTLSIKSTGRFVPNSAFTTVRS